MSQEPNTRTRYGMISVEEDDGDGAWVDVGPDGGDMGGVITYGDFQDDGIDNGGWGYTHGPQLPVLVLPSAVAGPSRLPDGPRNGGWVGTASGSGSGRGLGYEVPSMNGDATKANGLVKGKKTGSLAKERARIDGKGKGKAREMPPGEEFEGGEGIDVPFKVSKKTGKIIVRGAKAAREKGKGRQNEKVVAVVGVGEPMEGVEEGAPASQINAKAVVAKKKPQSHKGGFVREPRQPRGKGRGKGKDEEGVGLGQGEPMVGGEAGKGGKDGEFHFPSGGETSGQLKYMFF